MSRSMVRPEIGGLHSYLLRSKCYFPVESTRLRQHGFHKDPADQMIIATARCHQLRLLTQDERIRESGAVLVV